MTYEQCLTSLVHKSVLERERNMNSEHYQQFYIRSIQPFVDLQLKLIMLFSLPPTIVVDENLNIQEIERKWSHQAAQDMFDRCDTEKKLILDKIVAMERN